MKYVDVYSAKYQRINGYKIKFLDTSENQLAYISFIPSTRSVYDIALRESFIDGLVTMDITNREQIDELLKPSRLFQLVDNPVDKYIIQSVIFMEQQPDTRYIYSAKQNSTITIKRLGFRDETSTQKTWNEIYTNIPAFTSSQQKDSKNFNAGEEINTVISVQLPKFDISGNIYDIKPNDVIVITYLAGGIISNMAIEGIDDGGVSGVIRLQGTPDMRIDSNGSIL